MSATIDPQTEINEIELDNPRLLQTLITRQDRKNDVKAARKTYKEADDTARALLGEHDLQDGQVARIGQFKITKKAVASRNVQFETDPTSRLTISLIPEDA